MTNLEKISELKSIIDNSILPLITNDYVLWGLPYYINPGDTFIWEGVLDMLKSTRFKCIGTYGIGELQRTYLNEDIVILVMGGGFFGDLWREAWEEILSELAWHKSNPIIILPQSIFYQDSNKLNTDVKIINSLKNITICARDSSSYEIANKYFSCNTLLVPDMAFHMNLSKIKKIAKNNSKNSILLQRQDKEKSCNNLNIKNDWHICDWPGMSKPSSIFMHVINVTSRLLDKIRLKTFIKARRYLMYKFHRNVVIWEAVSLLSPYRNVYTTRLHAMILAYILEKNIYVIDNNYKKISGCYNTWLKGTGNVKYIE